MEFLGRGSTAASGGHGRRRSVFSLLLFYCAWLSRGVQRLLGCVLLGPQEHLAFQGSAAAPAMMGS